MINIQFNSVLNLQIITNKKESWEHNENSVNL